MKHVRLGMTESTLAFLYWLQYIAAPKGLVSLSTGAWRAVQKWETQMLNWLHITSGYYDGEVNGSTFGAFSRHTSVTTHYRRYMEAVFRAARKCDVFVLTFHDLPPEVRAHEAAFLGPGFLEVKHVVEDKLSPDPMFDLMRGRRVLIVSSFAPLMKAQVESGNCARIYPTFPTCASIETYCMPYTFFNHGPDENLIATAQRICDEIRAAGLIDRFDVALLSAGAYTALLAGVMHDRWNKDVFCAGGELQPFFGIASARAKQKRAQRNDPFPHPECWIMSIPPEYRPEGWQRIEGGCYW